MIETCKQPSFLVEALEKLGISGQSLGQELDRYLTVEQLRGLQQMESFGWSLAFVRRPLFQTPVAILYSADTQRYALLTEDGEIEYNPDLMIRA